MQLTRYCYQDISNLGRIILKTGQYLFNSWKQKLKKEVCGTRDMECSSFCKLSITLTFSLSVVVVLVVVVSSFVRVVVVGGRLLHLEPFEE